MSPNLISSYCLLCFLLIEVDLGSCFADFLPLCITGLKKKKGTLSSLIFEKNSETFHSTDIFKLLLLILLFSRPPTLLKEFSRQEYPGGVMSRNTDEKRKNLFKICSHAVLMRNQHEKREHILPLLLGRADEKIEKQSEVETFYW